MDDKQKAGVGVVGILALIAFYALSDPGVSHYLFSFNDMPRMKGDEGFRISIDPVRVETFIGPKGGVERTSFFLLLVDDSSLVSSNRSVKASDFSFSRGIGSPKDSVLVAIDLRLRETEEQVQSLGRVCVEVEDGLSECNESVMSWNETHSYYDVYEYDDEGHKSSSRAYLLAVKSAPFSVGCFNVTIPRSGKAGKQLDPDLNACTNIVSPGTYVVNVSAISFNAASGACFNVSSPDVILDLNGSTLTCNNTENTFGVWTWFDNNTIKNGVFSNCSKSIYSSGSHTTVFNNTITMPLNNTNNSHLWQGIHVAVTHDTDNISYNKVTMVSGYTASSIAPYLPSGILDQSGSNDTVSGNNVTTSGAVVPGIMIYTTSNSFIYSNNVTPASYAIYLYNNAINNSVYSNNLVAAYGYGINCYAGHNNTIYSNNITVTNSGWGAYLYACRGNNFYSNNITTTSGYGLRINLASNNTVYWNNITTTDASGVGIYTGFATATRNNTIYSNTITTSGASSAKGIYACDYCNISYNAITTLYNSSSEANGAFAIYANNNTAVTIIGNVINTTGNYGVGIWLSTATNSSNVTQNTIYTTGNNGYGVYLSSTAVNNLISDNTINTSGNSAYGITISSIPTINNSYFRNSITTGGTSSDGVRIGGNSSIVFLNNITTSGAAAYGIRDNAASNCNVSFNNITTTYDSTTEGNGAFGIYALTVNNLSFISNNVTSIGGYGYGVFFAATTNNSNISMNRIYTSGTAGDGIYLYGASHNNSVHSNTINTSGVSGYGVVLSSKSNFTNISYNQVVSGKNTSYGLYVYGSSNATLFNNEVNTTGNSSFAIYIASNSENTTVDLNTVFVSGASNAGIYLQSNNNFLLNNNFSSIGNSAYGIRLVSSNNTKVFGNRVFTNGSSSYATIVAGSSYNNFSLNDIVSVAAGSYAAYFTTNSFNNTFFANNLTTYASNTVNIGTATSSSSSTSNASISFTNDVVNCWGTCTKSVYINTSSNVTFTNVTFDRNEIQIANDVTYGLNSLTVRWFADLNVSYANGSPYANRWVFVTNALGEAMTPMMTDANGQVLAWAQREYSNYTLPNGSNLQSNYTPQLFAALDGANVTRNSTNVTMVTNSSAPLDIPVLIWIPTNSCGAPLINNTWFVNSADYCNFTDASYDLGTGEFRWYNTGQIVFLRSNLTAAAFGRNDTASRTNVYLWGSVITTRK